MTPGMQNVLKALAGKRFPLEDEKRCQVAIWSTLEASPTTWLPRREHRLTARDIIDFLVDRVGVEVKLKGSADAIRRQVERYLKSGELEGLVLVTNRPVNLPSTINGKPVAVLELGSAWL